jgi:hypothetical protein
LFDPNILVIEMAYRAYGASFRIEAEKNRNASRKTSATSDGLYYTNPNRAR